MHTAITWFIQAVLLVAAWLVISTLLSGRLRSIYREHFRESPRERLFLASVAFFLTFAIVRAITHAIRAGVGPFHDVVSGSGRHIHHMVWGILLLLIVGYAWLAQVGTGQGGNTWVGRVMALLYGIGAALVLDEFALWLNLRDVYWTAEGRISIGAVFLFGGLLSVGIWGGRFFHALARETIRFHASGFRRRGARK
jgi:hypothetical protein